MNLHKIHNPIAVPCKLWTIQRPYMDHPNYLPDGLDCFNLFIPDRVFTYPLQIEYIQYPLTPTIDEIYTDVVCDKVIYFSDGAWVVTHNNWLFETEEQTLNYLISEIFPRYRDIFLNIVDREFELIMQSKKILNLMNKGV